MSNEPTREELIALCERGIVAEGDWRNRDTARSQKKLGQAWAWLRAGCYFEFSDDPESDDKTIWITIWADGFNSFEWGGGRENYDEELFYIPTAQRLDAADGKDWY